MLRDTLRTVPPMYAAATAGPNLIADAGLTADDLLDGAWDDVVVRYRKWTGAAFDEATGVAAGVIGEWRTGYPAAMKATFGSHLDESADLLRAGLHGIAAEKFLDPKGLDEVGELVPNGFVRHVLARAGGTADITSSGYAYVMLTADGGPLPGLATGPLIEDALRDHGAVVNAFRWVYGPAFRSQPFRPHARLDGVVFRNFDDPKLKNNGTFPSVSYFIPGDHRGCRCDAEPIILTPEQADALGIPRTDPTPAQQARAAKAAAREAALQAAADEHGVSLDSIRAHLPDVRELRRAISADAARVQNEMSDQLSQGMLGDVNAAFLPRPPKAGSAARRTGEWDWLEGLTQEERSRLSRSWYVDGPGAGTIDEITDAFVSAGLVPDGGQNLDIIGEVWLPLNRKLEAAGAVRRGKLPVMKHYSGEIQVRDLAPRVDADGFDVGYVLGHSDEDVAGYLAARTKNEVGDQAYSALGRAAVGSERPPWQMGYQEWEAEVRDLEYSLRNAPGDVTPVMRARYDELVPVALDEAGLDHESLYSVIVETARVADLEVADFARIPWSDVDDVLPGGYLDELVRAAEAVEAAAAPTPASVVSAGLPYDLTAAAPRVGQRGWSVFVNSMVEQEVDTFRAGWRPNSEIGDGIVKIRLGEDGLGGVLDSGRFLSQHDVGRSGGVFDPAGRLAHERAMFGELDEHPIYGRIDDDHFGGKESTFLPMYGRYEVELRASVADRTSVTIGDSLVRDDPPAPMALLDVADADRARVRDAWSQVDMTNRYLQGSSYVEAQIHGGVTLDDISAVVVPAGEGTGPLADRLRALGITVKERS